MKLEDIKKENIYTVPDKYFDQLPTRIQTQVYKKKPVLGFSLNWHLAYKIAFPALAVLLMVFYFVAPRFANSAQSAEEILAQVSTEDLVAYLQTTDITTDEIIEVVDFTNIDLDFYDHEPIMQNMQMNEKDIDALLDEYGIDNDLL